MITLKLDDREDFIDMNENYLFNKYLIKNPEIITKLIHSMLKSYKIRKSFFLILNGYIDSSVVTMPYPGLVIRSDYNRYAVLYLETADIDDDETINIIKEFIYDKGEIIPLSIDLDKFEITEELFLEMTRDI